MPAARSRLIRLLQKIRLREEIGKTFIRNQAGRGSGQGQSLLRENQLTDNHTARNKNGGQDAEPTFDRLAESLEQEDSGWQADEEVVRRGEGDGEVDQR
jgi:hypothetical protein